MGFYLRKSLSFGPLRFNLSKSGIGVSAGVKGFRLGTGPRGNYVHVGRGGIYYRTTLPSGRRRPAQFREEARGFTPPTPPLATLPSEMDEIESASASAMIDANSAELLAEIDLKQKRWRMWPIAAAVTVLLAILLVPEAQSDPAVLLLIALPLCLTSVLLAWDRRRKTTVLFYELDEPTIAACDAFHRGFSALAGCERIWHISAQGAVYGRKYHAGASSTVNRSVVKLGTAPPPLIKTNVAVACIPVGRQRLYFFPDRILFYDTSGVGAVEYEHLQLSVEKTRFIESESVPSDAQIVDRTWQYVNKNGGPDRRFAANRELPIALYEELTLRSRGGLNEKLQLSRIGTAAAFVSAAATLARALRSKSSVHRESAAAPAQTIGTSEAFVAPPDVNEANAQPHEARCFYYFLNSVQGPVSRSELASLLANGAIDRETLVCSDDDQHWAALSNLAL